ncbi:hypothetical protein VTN49DRAFT_2290 [Thermomyces lanuginosus]|uniref:uncharacterized protein n=1 Tax=Thermomyces lanuginosus TaxID=5541 RepID=UPI0037434788
MSAYNSHAQPQPDQPGYAPRHAGMFNAGSAGSAPAGTFLPGTKVQVGSHRVVVEKYLSEGGFAHVYVVRLPHPVDGADTAVLKRVAVPDKAALANMRTEVETMKKLKGHRHIVKYIDSHASQLKGGGYEVFLLMENCQGGGLIDFMNTRLQNRLTEPEILRIFRDVAEGVACMHYLKPPLLHRDLKVENVLISVSGQSTVYKLCDFGSAAPPRPAPTSAAEGRLIEDDIQRHTTMQYRSPEMIDVYRGHPIDEKSDIWALGVLLYKLCYYTTPFEEVGQMAILNASYKFPSYPPFSDRLKRLIASMLQENPQKRPTIYEVLREACHMQGKEVPIHDIYSERTRSETRRYQELPPLPTDTPKIGAVFSAPIQENTTVIPEIAPMRRGRPSRPTSQNPSAKPSPSPYRGGTSDDPFAALDGVNNNRKTTDELSARFPTLDEFSLLHERNGRFEFEPTVTEAKPDPDELSRRVANALADEAFRKPSSPALLPSQEPTGNNRPTAGTVESKPRESASPRVEPARSQPPLHEPTPERPQKPKMVSVGTMTDPPPGPEYALPPSNRQIYRFPPPSSQEQLSGPPWLTERGRSPADQPSTVPSQTTKIEKVEPRRKSSAEKVSPRLPSSARQSLEGSRPSLIDLEDVVSRPKSANTLARPASVQLGAKLGQDSSDPAATSLESRRALFEEGGPSQPARTDEDRGVERTNITSDIDFLRAREEEERDRKKEKRTSGSHKHAKKSSLSSINIPGKGLLSGRFGDAFRRFEQNAPDDNGNTPSPTEAEKRLTSFPGSEPTDLSSDDELEGPDVTDISPEVRRELERRRLSQEEKRVANAAAEYRQRVAGRGVGGREGPAKSSLIQERMQSLLQDHNKPPPKTATGYGRYTDDGRPMDPSPTERESAPPLPTRPKPQQLPERPAQATGGAPQRTGQRPVAPPKPKNLRTGGTSGPTPVVERAPTAMATGRVSPSSDDDPEANFNRRFPSLSGLEMETDIPKLSTVRTREV